MPEAPAIAESLLKDPPPELIKLIDYLANPSLTLQEVDQLMSWDPGQTSKKLRQYPLLARTANEARVIAFRNAGLESPRLGAYKVIVDALGAEKSEPCGEFEYEKVPDHVVRLKAANQILKVLGDDSNITVNNIETELHVKIYQLVQAKEKAKSAPIEAQATTGEITEKPRGMQIVR